MLAQPTSFSGKRSTSTSINIRGKSIDKSKGKGKSKGEDAELSEEWKELTTALDAVYEGTDFRNFTLLVVCVFCSFV